MAYDALFAADLHIKRRPDEQYALQQIVNIAVAEGVSFVVLLGDLLDKQTNRSEPITYFHQRLEELRDHAIDVRFLQGNHDFDDPPWLSGHRHAKHFHKCSEAMGPYYVYGLDYQPYGPLQEELQNVPSDCNLLLTHQGWGEWLSFEGAPQGDFAQIPEHVNVVVSGDLHQSKMETKHKNAGGQPLLTISPGAVAMQKIDEPSEHYVVLMNPKGEFVRKKLRSRAFQQCSEIQTPEHLDQFMSTIEANLARLYQQGAAADVPENMLKPRLRVIFSRNVPDVVRRVRGAVGERAFLHWKELIPEKPERQKSSQPKGAAATPLSVLKDEVHPEEDAPLFEFLGRMLEAEDPQTEFARWRAEQTAEA